MKKLLALILAVVMALAFTACGSKDNSTTGSTETGKDTASAEKTNYTLGMGVQVSTDSSKAGNAQVDATYAAVILDGDGKIAVCKIDCAQNKMAIADGAAEKGAEYKTKYEKGDEYDMRTASGIGKEWFEQADAFAEYVIGKSADEVSAIAIGEDGKTTDADLLAGCTMSVDDIQKAVVKAAKDEQSASFTADAVPELSIAGITEDSSTKDAAEGADGVAAMYTTFAAVAKSGDKTLATLVDEIQPKIAFDMTGAIGEVTFKGTKRELKEDYNMKSSSGIGKEWYEQAKAFCEFTVGKTAAEIKGIAVGEDGKTTDADLLAGCTITVTSMISAVEKALG